MQDETKVAASATRANDERPPTRLTLLGRTIELIRHRDRTITYDHIQKSTGVSVAFINRLVSDSPPQHPSVDSIQKLYEFLSGKPLKY